MNKAVTTEELDGVLDRDKNWAIINSSNWPATLKITPSTRHQLLQHLLMYEVFQKRRSAITCLANGMAHFSILPLLRRHIHVLISHVKEAEKITASMLLSVTTTLTETEKGEIAFQWFKDFVRAGESKFFKSIEEDLGLR